MATRKKRKRKARKVSAVKTPSRRKSNAPIDHSKDPLFKFKPNDLISVIEFFGDGEEQPPVIHLVVDELYERDPALRSGLSSLRLKEDRLVADTLFFLGDEACKVTALTDTHLLEMKVHGGKLKWKVAKKRKSKKVDPA
jgi:hypothetical protein